MADAQENTAIDSNEEVENTPEMKVSDQFDQAQAIQDRIADLNARKEKILKAREDMDKPSQFLKIKALPEDGEINLDDGVSLKVPKFESSNDAPVFEPKGSKPKTRGSGT